MSANEPTPAPPSDPDALRAEIERTRDDLGDTVNAIAAKADVKARAKSAAGEARGRMQDTATVATEQATLRASEVRERVRQRPAPVAAAAGGLLAVVGTIMIVRRWRAKAHTPERRWQRAR
ncbi:DUF3618 domain-containing protein [Phytohabitans kaempferiae]|uniref:DUF3618 domain-containing protein n=1 Tax=Phytohabitans kaempferiae TaxID=1620943 RepID=A0ABV6MG21_9ACTN